MKRLKGKSGGVLINILIAVAISLIVNFSHFVFLILTSTNAQTRESARHLSGKDPVFLFIEVLFYVFLAFALLSIFTWNTDKDKAKPDIYYKRLLIALLVSVCIYFFAPNMNRHGDFNIMLTSYRLFNPMVLLKFSFTLVVVTLYGKIYELIGMQQKIIVENEKLKTENLRSRYDVLINQMNPHFFFNSLNSLAMLVRESKNNDALNYIDRLSDTFRYIIQSGKNSMTTLREEILFLESYKYLLEIRYEGKLFIDVEIPEEYMERTLPTLTLQPLVENAVKHNTITRSKPLHVTLTTKGDNLFISNPIQPKIDASESGTGIGLKNVASRYKLLTDGEISVIDDGHSFTVRLPLGVVPNSHS